MTDGVPRHDYNGKSQNTAVWVAIGLSAFMSLAAAFWTIANPRDDIKSLRAEFKEDLAALRKDGVTTALALRSEIEQRETLREQDVFSKTMEVSMARIVEEITRLRLDHVPKSEHAEHWREIDNQVSVVRMAVDAIRADYNKTYNVGDQMRSLQDQITELRKAQLPINVNTKP